MDMLSISLFNKLQKPEANLTIFYYIFPLPKSLSQIPLTHVNQGPEISCLRTFNIHLEHIEKNIFNSVRFFSRHSTSNTIWSLLLALELSKSIGMHCAFLCISIRDTKYCTASHGPKPINAVVLL
jgi:hypothetical protein